MANPAAPSACEARLRHPSTSATAVRPLFRGRGPCHVRAPVTSRPLRRPPEGRGRPPGRPGHKRSWRTRRRGSRRPSPTSSAAFPAPGHPRDTQAHAPAFGRPILVQRQRQTLEGHREVARGIGQAEPTADLQRVAVLGVALVMAQLDLEARAQRDVRARKDRCGRRRRPRSPPAIARWTRDGARISVAGCSGSSPMSQRSSHFGSCFRSRCSSGSRWILSMATLGSV